MIEMPNGTFINPTYVVALRPEPRSETRISSSSPNARIVIETITGFFIYDLGPDADLALARDTASVLAEDVENFVKGSPAN